VNFPGNNGMKCMFCQNVATVHLTNIVNHQGWEAHLCEHCARERNLLGDAPGPQINLQALVKLLATPLVSPHQEAETACPVCGQSYAAFKAEGRLGCSHDYEAFRGVLEPLLERVHRSTVHQGKFPVAAQRIAELEELQSRMQVAVAAEDYEQAARLRDLIRQKQAEGRRG
jgi:protein arginine kinase activator